MPFVPEPDTTVADWWLDPAVVDDPWVQCRFGPPAYAAHVRFRHHEGADPDEWVLSLVAEHLAAHTTTPHDVVVAQWDGNFGGGFRVTIDPATDLETVTPEPYVYDDAVMSVPRARLLDDGVAVRDYLLLRGPVTELGAWPTRAGEEPPDLPELVCGAMWPRDRAWFYAWDVDDDVGATVGCDRVLAQALLADERFATWAVRRPGGG